MIRRRYGRVPRGIAEDYRKRYSFGCSIRINIIDNTLRMGPDSGNTESTCICEVELRVQDNITESRDWIPMGCMYTVWWAALVHKNTRRCSGVH